MVAEGDIKYVVVLMMENRSFDNLLGHLNLDGDNLPASPRTNFIPADSPDGVPFHTFEYPDSGTPAPWDDSRQELPAFPDVRCDPGHSHAQIAVQLQGRDTNVALDSVTMGGFAEAHHARTRAKHRGVSDDALKHETSQIMGWHPAHHVPALSELAREYTVCARWFCSVPGETWPNRMFAHQGHSSRHVANEFRGFAYEDSIFDILTEQRVEWAVYAGDIPQAAVHVGFKDAFFRQRLVWSGEFFDDVENGHLPAYSFIEPRHFLNVNSQHPTADVALGDDLIRKVYEALAAQPDIWDHLLFIVTWDEHGGFYDHEPPVPAIPPHAGQDAVDALDLEDKPMKFRFDVSGVRVPALVISPWSKRGEVSQVPFDHTSIIKSVFRSFAITDEQVNGRLGARVKGASDVLDLLGDERRSPARLSTRPHSSLARSRLAVAQRDLTLESLDDLDSLQLKLLELKRDLDSERHVRYVAGPPAGETPAEAVSRLVREFQANHLAPRGTRPAAAL